MDITYLGHSSFKIKGKNALVVTDPFNPKMVGLKYPKLSEVDIVTVSHQHEDHGYLENITEPKIVVDAPGEYEVSGVSITGVPSFHDDKKGALRGKNTIFVLEVDGIRIVHLGDLGHKLSEEEIEDLGEVDILLVPVGGFYTISPETASEIVRDIEPKIVIPMHYKVPGENEEVFKDVSDASDFLKLSGMSVENLEKLSLKKIDLTEAESKVVVLEIKS